jgi:hypothetical protein
MRIGFMWLIGLLIVSGLPAAEGEKSKDGSRFGVALDLAAYPQGKAEETLASVLKAIENKRLDYLAAQLSDPVFIDGRVKLFGGHFQDQVDDTRARLDPSTIKLLQRFAKEGEWRPGEKETMVALKDIKDRFVFFHKIGDRWFMDHRSKPAGKTTKE